jgi:hypothetical protein
LTSRQETSRDLLELSIRTVRLAYCIVIVVFLPGVVSADTTTSEYPVKAAIIYKIAKFVAWPEDAFSSRTEALPVCLAEADPIGPALDALSGKIVWGHPIAIKRLSEVSRVESDCRILFLGQDSRTNQNKLVSNVGMAPVLTIGDSNDFIDLGGIVMLEIEQHRVRFAINVAASERAGLNISAQLLQLARIRGEGS